MLQVSRAVQTSLSRGLTRGLVGLKKSQAVSRFSLYKISTSADPVGRRSYATFPEVSRLLPHFRYVKDPKTVAIVGCPFSGGQPRAGVDQGPIALVKAGLSDQLRTLGWNVKFDGHHQFEDISVEQDPPIGILKRPRMVSRICESVAKVVGGHIHDGTLPLTLGGDHSLAMGTISGTLSKHPDAVVVWVDAHSDINTVATTPTGNIHGMPAAFLLGLPSTQGIPEFSWIKSFLKPSNIVFIGLRDVDPGEKRILKENGIMAFGMHEVDKYGIGEVVRRALDAVNPHRDRPIHLTFDVDALDPSVAPSTGTPVRGGLTFREGHYICEAIAETGLLAALDLVEVNPSLNSEFDAQQTISVGCSLVRSALGETLL